MSLVSPIFRILKKVKTSNTEYCVRNYWFFTCHKYKTKREIKVSYKLVRWNHPFSFSTITKNVWLWVDKIKTRCVIGQLVGEFFTKTKLKKAGDFVTFATPKPAKFQKINPNYICSNDASSNWHC